MSFEISQIYGESNRSKNCKVKIPIRIAEKINHCPMNAQEIQTFASSNMFEQLNTLELSIQLYKKNVIDFFNLVELFIFYQIIKDKLEQFIKILKTFKRNYLICLIQTKLLSSKFNYSVNSS